MTGLSNSIFNVPNSLGQIRRDEDIVKVYTKKIIPQATSQKANFSGSDVIFDFTLKANQWWLPSRSFVVIQDSIYIGNGGNNPVQPEVANDVATAFNSQDNLFDGCKLTVGGFSLGEKTKYLPQISACKRRLSKSAGFNEGVAKSVYSFEPDYNTRKNNLALDGVANKGLVPDTITIGDGGNTANLAGTITTVAPALLPANVLNNRVEGLLTTFTADFDEGDFLETAGGNVYMIQTIESDTRLQASSSFLAVEGGVTYQKKLPVVATIDINNDVVIADRKHRNEKLYVPPLGIFDCPHALPPSRYQLYLTPKTDVIYKQSALESATADLVLSGGARDTPGSLPTGEYEYLVDNIVFYMCVVENYKRPPDKQDYVLDLEEIEVLPRAIYSGNVIENFTVSKSCHGLSIALQDRRAGTNTLFSPSLFKAENDDQNKIRHLRVDYAGQTRPNPQKLLQFDDATGIDIQTWGYAETAIEDLGYYDTGGVLKKDDWRKLGELFHYQFRKADDDISTDVNINVTYDEFTAGNDTQHHLLLFHHFHRIVQFTIQDNKVTVFSAQDA